MQYHTLNYDAQVKMGWDLNQPASGTGLTVRWHESPYVQTYGWGPPPAMIRIAITRDTASRT